MKYVLGMAALLLLVVTASYAGAARESGSSGNEAPRALFVTGVATESVPNTQAEVRLGVEVRRATAEEAHRQAAQQTDRLISELRTLDVRELGTTGVNLRVEHRSVDGNREVSGYVAVNTVRFVAEIEAAGEALDRGVAAGATRIDGVRLQPDAAEFAAAMERVEAAAARDALARADRLLQELGLSRTEIGFVRLMDSGYGAHLDGAGGSMLTRAEALSTTPVEAGTSMAEARVELQVRY